MSYYILDGRTPKSTDASTWERWFRETDRRVALTQISDDIVVSTVFVGLDVNLDPANPALFETEIIQAGDEASDRYRRRYATWTEAEQGHAETVAQYAIRN